MTKAEAVEEEIKRRLLAGAYQPGSPLRIEAIASDLRVSHTPVKEALRRLSAQGFVTYEPHRGVRVRVLDREDAEDVYRLRQLLEGVAVERAATQLGRAELNRLETLQHRMQTALVRSQFKTVSSLNQEFHMAIYQAAGSRRLVEMIQTLWAAFPRAVYWDNRARVEASVPEHGPILQALAAVDGPRARSLMEAHIGRAYEFVVDRLAAISTGGSLSA